MRIYQMAIVLAVLALVSLSGLLLVHKKPHIPAYLQRMGGDFTVHRAHGSLRLADLRGKVVLLYFGYTHCPDVCPATLSVMSAAIRQLNAWEKKRVQGLFVSLDPRRDTPEVLQAYTKFFSPKIIGATASREVLNHIAQQWHFTYHTPEHPKDKFYVVTHPNFLYVLNKEGKVVALLDAKSTPDDVVNILRTWLF